jgi:hypothetical protein
MSRGAARTRTPGDALVPDFWLPTLWIGGPPPGVTGKNSHTPAVEPGCLPLLPSAAPTRPRVHARPPACVSHGDNASVYGCLPRCPDARIHAAVWVLPRRYSQAPIFTDFRRAAFAVTFILNWRAEELLTRTPVPSCVAIPQDVCLVAHSRRTLRCRPGTPATKTSSG